MDIQRQAFEESNNVKPDWSFKFDVELQQYVALDHGMQMQVEEFNEHWDTFCAGWQAAKSDTVPDGFVVVPREPTINQVKAMTDYALGEDAQGLEVGMLCNEAKDVYKAMIEVGELK